MESIFLLESIWRLYSIFAFWSIFRLILEGKMTTLKNAQQQALNIIFLEIFFSEASLII